MPNSKNFPPLTKPRKLKKEQLLRMDVNDLNYSRQLPIEQLSEVQRLHRAEFRRQRPNVIKRLGHTALDGVAVAALVATNVNRVARGMKAGYKDASTGTKAAGNAYIQQANKRAEQARRSPGMLRRIGSFVTDVALNRLSKRRERRAQEDKLWAATRSEAVNTYWEQNPDVAEHEAKLQQQKQGFEDIMARGRMMPDPIREDQRTGEHLEAHNIALLPNSNVPQLDETAHSQSFPEQKAA